jgi:flagellin
MNVVNTNISALRATNASTQAGRMLGTAMERLSTGRRINSAADDAAGLAIAASMTSQIRGMAQGVRNANDGISLAQTAEGALDEVTNMLQRMRELTVQRSNETYSATDIANIDAERDALAGQINQVIENTTFNGINLFSTATNDISIQAGAEAVDALSVTLPDLE